MWADTILQNISHIHIECDSGTFCKISSAHKTLLWIWIMLCMIQRTHNNFQCLLKIPLSQWSNAGCPNFPTFRNMDDLVISEWSFTTLLRMLCVFEVKNIKQWDYNWYLPIFQVYSWRIRASHGIVQEYYGTIKWPNPIEICCVQD